MGDAVTNYNTNSTQGQYTILFLSKLTNDLTRPTVMTYANTLKSRGKFTIVAMKGIDTTQLANLANATIKWDNLAVPLDPRIGWDPDRKSVV